MRCLLFLFLLLLSTTVLAAPGFKQEDSTSNEITDSIDPQAIHDSIDPQANHVNEDQEEAYASIETADYNEDTEEASASNEITGSNGPQAIHVNEDSGDFLIFDDNIMDKIMSILPDRDNVQLGSTCAALRARVKDYQGRAEMVSLDRYRGYNYHLELEPFLVANLVKYLHLDEQTARQAVQKTDEDMHATYPIRFPQAEILATVLFPKAMVLSPEDWTLSKDVIEVLITDANKELEMQNISNYPFEDGWDIDFWAGIQLNRPIQHEKEWRLAREKILKEKTEADFDGDKRMITQLPKLLKMDASEIERAFKGARIQQKLSHAIRLRLLHAIRMLAEDVKIFCDAKTLFKVYVEYIILSYGYVEVLEVLLQHYADVLSAEKAEAFLSDVRIEVMDRKDWPERKKFLAIVENHFKVIYPERLA